MDLLVLLLVALLAFANGANDSGKGVATLVGLGAARPRTALLWATGTTAAGAGASLWLAGGLVKSFSTGLFAAGTALDAPFYAAVLAGACGWVLLATVTGMPVSTTHAITGALTGAGLVAFGARPFEWGFLGAKLALPLAVSPLLSTALVYLLAWPVLWLVSRAAGRCACIREQSRVVPGMGAAAIAAASVEVLVDEEARCEVAGARAVLSGSRAAEALHWLSSGMVGFARGWNDAPKIGALGMLVLAGRGGAATAFAVVTVAMAAGGLLAGGRVLETLARKLTVLPLPESLTASMTTAALVGLASWNGLPVSTTHVATGAIIGAGLKHDPGGVRWGKVREIREIVLSWGVTLPVAAAFAAAFAALVRLAVR
jgi:inorganic phosphate transporter, PiT family